MPALVYNHPLTMKSKNLDKFFYDFNSPAAFTGLSAVYREAKKRNPKLKLKDVKEYMHTQDTYTLHKPVRCRFPRNKVVAVGMDTDWQADLCDLKNIQKFNDGACYLLTVIDVLSKHSWVEPTKSKTPVAVRDAFALILKRADDRKPWRLFTDNGTEFLGNPFQKFLQNNDIQHLTSRDPNMKASVVERYNRTLKTRIWKYMTKTNSHRYIDDLQKIVDAINRSYHRSIKMRPIDVNLSIETDVWETLYGPLLKSKQPLFKFDVGDKVRISKHKHIFVKGYLPNFTEEIFTVTKCIARDPPVYRLQDYNGEDIEGVFYEHELVKTIKEDEIFKIEKILKTRKHQGQTEVFVNWMGYPTKFNQWIPQSQLVSVM